MGVKKPPSQLGTIQASSNRIKADVYEQFQSCSVMAGFLLQEIIKCEAPMLATCLQFEDHWSTTLLTGTRSAASPGCVYQIHAAPSRNR